MASTTSTTSKTYIHGEPVPTPDAHAHVTPLKTYLGIFGALMFLTVLTVLVSFMDMGPYGIYPAMMVAVVKAALVIGYFMHLKWDDRFHSFVFLGTILFVAIFFALTFADLTTRDLMQGQWANDVLQEERIRATPEMLEARERFLSGSHGETPADGAVAPQGTTAQPPATTAPATDAPVQGQ